MRRTPAAATVLTTVVLVLAATVLAEAPATGVAVPSRGSAPTTAAAAARIGAPRVDYVPTSRAYFSYPNRKKSDRMVIRDRVLKTIQSTWGGHRTRGGLARAGNGVIRIATWSFKDWKIAKALV